MTFRQRNPLEESYSLCMTTGLLTDIAAASGTAGHLVAMRWTSTTHACLIQSVSAVWNTITGFTAEQEVGLDLVVLRAYTASHTDGSAAFSGTNPWTSGMARHPNQAASKFVAADVRFASGTSALTAGTHSLVGKSFARGGAVELAAGAGVYKSTFACSRDFTRGDCPPLRLTADNGILLRNLIAIPAASGTARVTFNVEWQEVLL